MSVPGRRLARVTKLYHQTSIALLSSSGIMNVASRINFHTRVNMVNMHVDASR